MSDHNVCTYKFIPTNGPVVVGEFKLEDKPGENAKQVRAILQNVFGDAYSERVTVFWEQGYCEMYVDEIGQIKGLPLNPRATEIYRNNIMVHEPGRHVATDLPTVAGDVVLFDRRISLHL